MYRRSRSEWHGVTIAAVCSSLEPETDDQQ